MNAIAFLLWSLIAIEYIMLTREYSSFNTFCLLGFSNILLFWVCQKSRVKKACDLSSILMILTLSSPLLYYMIDRRQRLKLLIKIFAVFMLLSINYDV